MQHNRSTLTGAATNLESDSSCITATWIAPQAGLLHCTPLQMIGVDTDADACALIAPTYGTLLRACLPARPQVQLFDNLADFLGWQPQDWHWSGCMDWDAMVADLLSPDGTCFMAAAGGRAAEVLTPTQHGVPQHTERTSDNGIVTQQH